MHQMPAALVTHTCSSDSQAGEGQIHQFLVPQFWSHWESEYKWPQKIHVSINELTGFLLVRMNKQQAWKG